MRNTVWLVWDGQALLEVCAMAADAEHRAAEARAGQGIRRQNDPQGRSVRVEPRTVSPPSEPPRPDDVGKQQDAILERVDRDWGLLEIPPMGTAHFFHLDTYLVVPYRNRLVCPAFQFDHWRELWPGFRDVLGLFRDAGWDEFSIVTWFAGPQGATDGDIPAVLIRDEPERVLHAARVTANG